VHSDVRDLDEIDEHQLAEVGGKAAHLGALMRIDGVEVPPGFCVTTGAFRRAVGQLPAFEAAIAELAVTGAGDRDVVARVSASLRLAIEAAPVPEDVARDITRAIGRLGEGVAVAVRSSATAEDLPTASFAGQQDTSLNVVGATSVLDHVRRCWASLFTERAIAYRAEHGIDHRRVRMAVVVQRMVPAQASGVLFTADPLTSNRTVVSIEATLGLGEALVAGQVTPDRHRVRDGEVTDRTVAAKLVAVEPAPGGGTRSRAIEPARRDVPALTDEQALRLAGLGRRIAAHLGCPQDVEWCLVDDVFLVVQSRPITTLFPIPRRDDDGYHIYLSVGHQQMMTDALKPLGLSMWQLIALPTMHEAAGRLFVDVTAALGVPAGRAGLLEMMGRADPLFRDALETVLDANPHLPARPVPSSSVPPPAATPTPTTTPPPIEFDERIVIDLMERSRRALGELELELDGASGLAVFDVIEAAVQAGKRALVDPRSQQAVMAGMDASWWLNEHVEAWLGDTAAADALTQSVPYNVTSEMGLALLDVADVVRSHPAALSLLRGEIDDGFLDDLEAVPGGPEVREAIEAYLDRYGMRCIGEIDITRPRWRERPSTLVPAILDNVRNVAPGEATRRFEAGLRAARVAERDLLERVRALPDGDVEAERTKAVIDRLRTFIGYREFPKYDLICRHDLYKRALLREVDRLVQGGVLDEAEDAFFLRFEELRDAVGTGQVDHRLVAERKASFHATAALRPPRVLTSEGDAIDGSYRRDGAPPGALVGLAVSSGTVEGRARVVTDMADADLETGDILVTTFTDPSWSPLFVSIAALVTEIGGLMTHGAVIAREYGLPAVVGVEGATRLIRDGQRIRVDAGTGVVELLGP
jgi:phosphoenolpyruvate synthase/pyruvate phosphate dikinase